MNLIVQPGSYGVVFADNDIAMVCIGAFVAKPANEGYETKPKNFSTAFFLRVS